MAISKQRKEEVLNQYADWLKRSQAVLLVEYTGAKMKDLDAIRAKIRESGGEFHIMKNTLAKRALKGTAFESLTAHFEGSTAIAYTETDPVALAKTLTTFMKTAPSLQIKAAVVQGQPIKPAEVTDLANMPGKPELYAKLLFLLNAPATNLVRVLSAVPRDFMNVLAASEKKRA